MPMSEEEKQLMEDIYVATREAHNEGVSKTRIAGLLAFFASGAVDPKSLGAEQRKVEPDAHDLEERLSQENEPEQAVCPSCKEDGTYTEINDVRSQLGGQLLIDPCGCIIEWENRDQLGEWVEQLDPLNDVETSED